jgi:hypothetical protein
MLQAMNVPTGDDSIRCEAPDRFVDYIVSEAILEITIMLLEVLFATNDTTDKSADTATTHPYWRPCNCN